MVISFKVCFWSVDDQREGESKRERHIEVEMDEVESEVGRLDDDW